MFDSNDETGVEITRSDLVTLLFLSFVVLFILVIWLINPKQPPKKENLVLPPGRVSVLIRWVDIEPIDIDIWQLAPLDEKPVGYKHPVDRVSSLTRDDMGDDGHGLEPLNLEMTFTQGLPPGEYTINVHYFNDHGKDRAPPPVDVSVLITIFPPFGSSYQMAEKVTLAHPGEELTVVRFRLDDLGHIVPGSKTNLFRKLTPLESPLATPPGVPYQMEGG